jgi:predicted permease
MLLALRDDHYRDPAVKVAFFDRLAARLQSTPGIESITIASQLPAASARRVPYEISGAPPVDVERRPTVPAMTIGSAYFKTLGAALISGRDFNEFDRTTAPPVAIVNQQFASLYWPADEPLGKRVRLFDGPTAGPWLTVVGVTSNIVQNVDVQAHDPLVYRPYRQQPEQGMWVLVRSRASEGTLAAAFRREVRTIDADLPIWLGPFTLDERLAGMGNYWSIRNDAALFAVFAAIALLLASIGLYAVVTHSVSQRTQEFGIRIAIGATTRDLLALVLRQGMVPLGIGLTIGLAASLAVTPLLKSQLVQVPPVDPLTLVVTSAVLLVAATLGCVVPARRAMRVDPVVALRHD